MITVLSSRIQLFKLVDYIAILKQIGYIKK